MELQKILEEELKRFNQIGDYVGTLSEQGLGVGTGSGFVNPQGGSVVEQEDPEEDAPEEDVEGGEEVEDFGAEIEGEIEGGMPDEEVEGEVEGEDVGGDIEGDIGGEEEVGDTGTEEVDVTDIVNMAKDAESKAGEAKETLDAQTNKIDSLVSKLDDLETKLGSIDQVIDKIEELETEIIDAQPPTPVEQLELRSLDSGPFSQKPLDFWQDKKEEMEGTGKHEYVLTKDEVEDFSSSDIKKSFEGPTEEQKEDEEEFKDDEVSVLGNKPNK
mgnify:FL=1|jgi:hypothetical protein